MMYVNRVFIALAIVMASVHLRASDSNTMISQYLFTPELIMKHQDELGLTNDQKKNILKNVTDAQKKITELQWNLKSEAQKLGDNLKTQHVDQSKSLDQAKKVTSLEQEIKLAHLS